MKLSAVILAGGKNTRMKGRDKAFLKVRGELIIERQLLVLKKIFKDIVIISNRPSRYAKYNVRAVKDKIRAIGPLGGIYTGLQYIKNEAAFFWACDMPFLHNAIIKKQLAYFKKKKPLCLVARCKGIQPLHSIYSKKTIGFIKEAISSRELSLKKCLNRFPGLSYISFPAKSHKHFLNLNSPEALQTKI